MQRIAVLSVHSSPLGKPGARDTGGMSIYIRELANKMADQGLSLDIFTRRRDSQSPEIIEPHPGVRLIQLNAGEARNVDKLVVYSYLECFAGNVERFRRESQVKYDLIFSHYWLSGVAGKALQELWQVPHVMMFHTLGEVKNDIGLGEDEPELRIVAEGELARDCQGIIASTHDEKNWLIRKYGASGERIKVIPCGVNLELFHPMNRPEAKRQLGFANQKIILFVGRIERLKGIDNLLKTLPLFQNGLKPKLVIVGGDGYRQGEIGRLKRLASALHVEDSVVFSGLTDYERMPTLYNAADVCVFPSFYESFGLVPLESLACGTPVVATNVGDLRNIIQQGRTGYVLADNLPAHLAEKIASILASVNNSLADSAAIRSSIESFGWNNIALLITRQFEGLVGTSHQAAGQMPAAGS
jgi:D-inositol-3-phosphate glycosyltransferase